MAGIVAAALIPGLPHLLASKPAPSWKRLAEAVTTIGRDLRQLDVDSIVMMSTQWFTVLGHQFQMRPALAGRHHDENWYRYDYGKMVYDLTTDVELTSCWAELVDADGMQVRLTDYDNYPIDTGTIVASQLLGLGTDLPISIVSCNLYADADAMRRIGNSAAAAATKLGRRTAIVAVSSLSADPIQQWIDPADDRFQAPEQDAWNQRILKLLSDGDVNEVSRLRADYGSNAKVDAQFRAFSFLSGSGLLELPARVLEYGPIWGTGAAAVTWTRPHTATASAGSAA